VSTSLKGLENFIIESEFIKPRTPPYGQSTLLTIQQLITEVLPTAQFVITASTDKIVSATGAWERDRWGAVTALAASISADIWCGYDGRWYITDVPDLGNLVGQYQIDGGPAGVMIEENREDTRDQVYNAVIGLQPVLRPDGAPAVGLGVRQRPDQRHVLLRALRAAGALLLQPVLHHRGPVPGLRHPAADPVPGAEPVAGRGSAADPVPGVR
jgi:hypothetical protein